MNSNTKGLDALKELQFTIATVALDNQFTETQATKIMAFAQALTKNIRMIENSYRIPSVKHIVDSHAEITSGLSDIAKEALSLKCSDQFSIMYGVAIKTVGLIELVVEHLEEPTPNYGYSDPALKMDLLERLELEDAYQQRLAQRLQ